VTLVYDARKAKGHHFYGGTSAIQFQGEEVRGCTSQITGSYIAFPIVVIHWQFLLKAYKCGPGINWGKYLQPMVF